MKEYRFCPACAKKGKFLKTPHEQFVRGHYKDENGYCAQCEVGEFASLDNRVGEGYIVVSTSNGVENTIPCYKCKGEGYLFTREYFVNDNHKE